MCECVSVDEKFPSFRHDDEVKIFAQRTREKLISGKCLRFDSKISVFIRFLREDSLRKRKTKKDSRKVKSHEKISNRMD